jgi:dephospho-CoA kinase
MTFFLGLTGSIATGKSTIDDIFTELGITVVDGDVVAKHAQEKGQPSVVAIDYAFPGVIDEEGNIDRKKLASIVFSDSEKLDLLNKTMEPFLRAEFEKMLDAFKETSQKIVVFDIPLMYELHYADVFDAIMVSFVTPEIQLERLMSRNNLTKAEAEARIHSQWPIEQKAKLADIVIDNSKSIEETRKQVQNWLSTML